MRRFKMLSNILFLSLFCCKTYSAEPIMLDTLHLNWLDKQISPAVNFYNYANGTWLKNNPIPEDQATWGAFQILNEKVEAQIHDILKKAAANPHKQGSSEQKVGDFYLSGLDEATINRLGASPLNAEFEQIDSIKNKADLISVLAHLHLIGVDALFNFGSMQDFKDSKKMIAAAAQGGLSLPDRDYYLSSEPHFVKIRAAYLNHLVAMFVLLGENAAQAKKDADCVLSLETKIAQASMSKIEQRDPFKIYHMLSQKEIQTITPNLSWKPYFEALGYPQIQGFNLAMPEFFKAINAMLSDISLTDWKTYLKWHLLTTFSPYLSDNFVNESFKMGAQLTGAEKLLPRYKRVVKEVNGSLAFAVGQLYVGQYFPAESKQLVADMLHNIRQALQEDLKTLAWMTPKTREAALKKLSLMGERVGYPDKWWDYSSLQIDKGPYVLNVKRANTFLVKRDLDKIGKPIDYTEWAMPPQMVNAYYDPSMNHINLPAGILQPPFFNPKAPEALNYGAIGFVIGHEITHGFDDKGALFDGDGNLNNWWAPEDLKRFEAATQCISKQFSTFKVNGNLPVQGDLVVGEATADLGGLTLAYRAFHSTSGFKTAPTLGGFTPDQQFFLGAAHMWAGQMRPSQAQRLITVDPHPPMMYRVNGTLSNMSAFQKAFDIPAGSPMINPHPCVIW